jgi:hypothetical protein
MHDFRRSRNALLIAVGLVSIAVGCSDSSTGPTSLQLTVSAAPASIPVDGASTITVQVITNLGQPAVGVPLEWGNSFGSMQLAGTTTDVNGRNSATLRGEGVAGVATVTVRVVGREERSQTEVRIGPG